MQNLLNPYVFEQFSFLMLAVIFVVVIVRLLKKARRKPVSGLSFPLTQMLMLLMGLILSVIIVCLRLSCVPLSAFLLLQSLLLLLYRYDFVRHFRFLIWIPVAGFAAYLPLAVLGTPFSMLVLVCVFVPAASVLEYLLLTRYLKRYLSDITLVHLLVFSETQFFKFCSVFLFSFSVLSWYLGWEKTSAVGIISYTAFCSFLLWNCPTGRRFVLSPASAQRLSSAFSKRYGANFEVEAEWDKGQSGIFTRLNYYFEKEKPFLNPDLNLAEVARMLYTNKVYLGRSIKNCGRTNFKRFINHYRVKYAMELFIKKPSLKVNQLCLMSGFKTKATFTSAFMLETGESPREWCDYIRSKK